MGYRLDHGHIEYPEAVAEFVLFWMPYDAPENWPKSWQDFKDGLLEWDQISKQQFKTWRYPEI